MIGFEGEEMDIPEKYKQVWSDWDIRVLILCSLYIQIILIFLGRLRKTSTSIWIRMLVWSSYLLADWVADFTLGQLSSNMDDDSSSSSSNAIIAFWAPFLILHLGGPDTITAYSMEDNELWARHLLGLGYELIIGFYVLFRSLPNTRLLIPTLLIFLVAIIKYVERSYSLYKASAKNFRSSVDPSATQLPKHISSSTILKTEDLNVLNGAFRCHFICKPFFVDINPRAEVYEEIGNLLKETRVNEIFTRKDMELSYAYDEFYTKAVVNHSRTGYVLRALCSICILLAFSLYVLAPKDSFNKLDVAITYVILAASIILDATATVMLLFSDWMVVALINAKKLVNWSELLAKHIVKIKRVWLKRRHWSGEIPQLNLIDNCLKNSTQNKAPRQRMVNWIEEKLVLVQETKLYSIYTSGMETFTLHTLQSVKATQELQEIIVLYAQRHMDASKKKLDKPAGITALELVTSAPTWAVPAFVKLIERLALDQQVLVWHIATELCLQWNSESLHPLHTHQIKIEAENNKPRGVKRKSIEMEACKYLSNYMMYMVLMRPEMMPAKRAGSLVVIGHAFYNMVQFIHESGDDHRSLMPNAKIDKACREMNTTPIEWTPDPSLFEVARVIAHLMLVIEEEERWQAVTTTWLELLMQTAIHTRGSMHVKQLSRGGDLLTFMWLLTKQAGMDTLDVAGPYMTGGAIEMAEQLLSMIKLHLQNQC